MIRRTIVSLLRSFATWLETPEPPRYCFLCGEPLRKTDMKWEGFRSNMPAHQGCDQLVEKTHGTCPRCGLFGFRANHMCNRSREG